MPYEIIHLPLFRSQAKKLGLTLEDIQAIEIEIMEDPAAYPVMGGTNGLRKMRYAPEHASGGKSGGIRVCYFIIVDASHIYLVSAFGKNEKENLTQAERKAIASIIATIRSSYER